MNKSKLILISLVAVLMFTLAHGQTKNIAFQADIPFAFTVGKTQFQPGTYQFVPEQNYRRLTVRGDKESTSTNVITKLGGASSVQDPSLVFDQSEGTRILSEVWIPGSTGLLIHTVPGDHSHELVVALPKEFSKLSGRETFERSCKTCHGPAGRGDPDADKFFKKTIPRLTSDYVQSKSDDELKDIITRGKSSMPPVRLDKPGVGHLLPADSVSAVVAYVRTLKGK